MEQDVILNKNDYKILGLLINEECFSPLKSLTITQLISSTELSRSKVIMTKNNFLLLGFIKEGSKDSNSKTYYITDKGINHFRSALGMSENEEMEDIDNENKGE